MGDTLDSQHPLYRALADINLRRDLGEIVPSELVAVVAIAIDQAGLPCVIRVARHANAASPRALAASHTFERKVDVQLRGHDAHELGSLTLYFLHEQTADDVDTARLGAIVARIIGREADVSQGTRLHQLNNSLATVLCNLELADAIVDEVVGDRSNQETADSAVPADHSDPTRASHLTQAVRQALEATHQLVKVVQTARGRAN